MEKYCNLDCKHIAPLSNTEECGIAICRYGNNWEEVELNKECKFIPKEYKCIDCDHFGNDFACLTAEENDNPCCGFIDIKESVILDILYEWKLRGFDLKSKMAKLIKEVEENFMEL